MFLFFICFSISLTLFFCCWNYIFHGFLRIKKMEKYPNSKSVLKGVNVLCSYRMKNKDWGFCFIICLNMHQCGCWAAFLIKCARCVVTGKLIHERKSQLLCVGVSIWRCVLLFTCSYHNLSKFMFHHFQIKILCLWEGLAWFRGIPSANVKVSSKLWI